MTDISVPCWNDVDIEELCNGARLIAFDLDNTLARSKKPMKDDMAECFSALTSLIDVAVITGGKYALLKSQVVERLTGQACQSHLHLMPTSGTRYYRWDGSDWAPVFAHDLSADDRAKAYESLERNAREQGIWLTHVWGERIEDRGSQITFSALGQLAPIEAKEAWDPTNEKKNRLARAVAAYRIWRYGRAAPAASISPKKTSTSRSLFENWPIFSALRWRRLFLWETVWIRTVTIIPRQRQAPGR